MANVRVKTTGPIFDQARREGLLKQGMKAAGKKLAPRIEAQVKTRLDIGTGRYRRSVESKVYPNGMVVVHSTDTIKRKTWLESGKRKGQKLWKGTGAWVSGKRLARAQIRAGEYEAEIARRLNG